MRQFARRVEAGTASTTVSYRCGRWWVSFTVRVDRQIERPAHVKAGAPVVGVDVGVTVATPDGHEVKRITALRHLDQKQTKQAWAQIARTRLGWRRPRTQQDRDAFRARTGWRRLT